MIATRQNRFAHAVFAAFGFFAALTGCSAASPTYESLIECRAPTNADGLMIAWLGTAGIHISDGTDAVLIDPFVSRHRMGALRVGLGLSLRPDPGAVKGWVDLLGARDTRAILITHSHYDHSIDAALFQQETGARVLGSATTRSILASHGFKGAEVIEERAPYAIGPFTVTFRRAEHGRVIGDLISLKGEVREPFKTPASAFRYRMGPVYAVVIEHAAGTVLFLGSGGLRTDTLEGVRADTVLLTLPGRPETAGFVRTTVGDTGAARVIPIHFDDILKPLSDGVQVMSLARFDEFVETTREVLPDVAIETLPVGKRCRLFR